MCELNKKKPTTPVEVRQQIFDLIEEYGRAQAKIGQLEGELQQKTTALNGYLQEQIALRERLTACVNMINDSKNKLNTADTALREQHRLLNECIIKLTQENGTLKLSNEAWIKRSIKLEFDMLMAQEEIKKIETSRDSAISDIALLERELRIIKSGNKREC